MGKINRHTPRCIICKGIFSHHLTKEIITKKGKRHICLSCYYQRR